MLTHGYAEVRSRSARVVTLALAPGEQCLKYHNELHRHVRVVQTVDTSQLVLGDVQDQVRAGKEGVYPDWALAFLDGLKLAQNIGILPQTLAQCWLLFHIAEFSQPLCTAIQIALVDTLAALGIQPDAVIGHSSGEIAGAYAAGALTAEEAILSALHRGAVTRL